MHKDPPFHQKLIFKRGAEDHGGVHIGQTGVVDLHVECDPPP